MGKATWNDSEILRRVKAGETRALKKCGVRLRQIAMDSIKTSKAKYSKPGEAPRQRPGKNFKKTIRWELHNDFVVDIGSVSDKHSVIPRVLEKGGDSSFYLGSIVAEIKNQRSEKKAKKEIAELKKKFNIAHVSNVAYKTALYRKRYKRYEERPFMRLALGKFMSKAAKNFENIL